MLNNSVVKSGTVLGVCFSVLAAVSSLTSCGASVTVNENINNNHTPPPIITLPSTIAAEAKKCADESMRGTVYYYCDCAAGADSGCVAGNDANAGTDPSAPRRTIANATARISGFTDNTNHTIAFCKGGAFNSVAANGEDIKRAGCTAGTDCDDIREYASPVFTSSAKPLIIETSTSSDTKLFRFSGNYGGVRILNLELTNSNPQEAGSGAEWSGYTAHDITVCNNYIHGFSIGITMAGDETVTASSSIHIRGNTITSNSDIAVLGAATTSEINYNYFENNGGISIYSHTIYMSGHIPMTNNQIVGNYIHNTYNPTCLGVVLVGHGEFDYLTVTDNVVDIDTAISTAGCYGIGFGSAATYPEANYFRHATFSRNTVINGGNTAMAITNAPSAVIEDNLIISDIVYGGTPGVSEWPIIGLTLSTTPSRTTPYVDDVNTAMTIRNNTVWFGPDVHGGAVGINTGVEGTNHIFANNTVTYSAATAVRTVGCFAHNLPNTSFEFVNNNHCYSAAGSYWRVTTDDYGQAINDSTRLNLTDWKTYAAAQGWDSSSIEGAPNFVNAIPSTGYDFHPNTATPLSPLLGKGSHANAPTYDGTNATLFLDPPAIGAYE